MSNLERVLEDFECLVKKFDIYWEGSGSLELLLEV